MRRQFTLILIISMLLTGYLFITAGEELKRSSYLNFSHQIHVEDAGMGCADCHASIEESEKANDRNIPGKDVCEMCHDVEDDENCTMCHVDLDNLLSFENPTRDYFFSHKVHVVSEELKCEKCHPGMEQIAMGDGEKIPSREICNSCHNGLAATMECLVCHTADSKFRPDTHTPSWQRQHMVEVRAGGMDCAHCHTNNYCQECHESTGLLSTSSLPGESYPPYSPQLNGDKGMVLKAVHDLNYRYLHQLDASGKTHECRTCHENSAYCAECHDLNGANSEIRPAWHGGPDWGALATAVGSGGGRHAELARRDIERCAACHDVQGADPTCLMCHIDLDGVRNTDPGTHESGFVNRFGEGSSFHNDESAVCFVCHTNTNQAGFGFCGYCHGAK